MRTGSCVPAKLAGVAGAGEGDAGARQPSGWVSRWGTAPPDFRDPEEGVTPLPPGSHHERHAAAPAPVQEPWALSVAWLQDHLSTAPEKGAWLGDTGGGVGDSVCCWERSEYI